MIETSIIVAVIIGLIQVVKTAGFPSKFAPLLSVALGVGAVYLTGGEATTGLALFNGVLYGLMASGLYSGVKAVATT